MKIWGKKRKTYFNSQTCLLRIRVNAQNVTLLMGGAMEETVW